MTSSAWVMQVGLGVDVVERVGRVRALLGEEALGEQAGQLGVPVRAAELVVAVGGDDADLAALEAR